MAIELDEVGGLCVDDARLDVRGDAVTVWRFHDAPAGLQALSNNGGDEDWLALVPPSMAGEYFGWMQSGGPFGCSCVDEHPIVGGWVVHIGAHA